MSVNTLFHSLKNGNIKPLYLITGKQPYISGLIRKEFKKLIPKSQQAMNFSSYSMENTSIKSLLNDASALPFLGKYHLIMIDNPYFLTGQRDKFVNPKIKKANHGKAIQHLTNYFQKPASSTILVIFAPYSKLDRRRKINKVLQKNAVTLDLSHLNTSFLSAYITDQINAKGYIISGDALDLLIRRTGKNISVIMNTLPRLFMYSYTNPKKEITIQAIKNLIPASLNENVFTLVNDVLYAKVTKADVLYNQLLKSGQQPLGINALLVSQFRVLLQSMILKQHGQNQWQITKTLHINPYRVKLALEADQHFTLNQLVQAYLGLVNIEVKLKSGHNNPQLLFEMFMTKYMMAIKPQANQ